MKSRNKDHKTHESIIGKIIYGFLLFMPLLAIGVTCAYAIFNKNAYKSYSEQIQPKYESNIVNTTNDLIRGNIYHITINEKPATNINLFRATAIFNLKQQNYYNTSSQGNEYQYQIVIGPQITIRDENYYSLIATPYETPFEFDVVYFGNISNNANDYITFSRTDFNIYENLNKNAFLDNVFYYSIDKVQQSPLFNWAEDSAIYTGMTATCNTLNITTPFIPLLMTYWLIISVIYILYDIILVILHIFHKKIHQLEDSF